MDADPVAEKLDRRVMRLQAKLAGRMRSDGHTGGWPAWTLTPDPETEQLVAELLRRPGA